MLTNLAYAGGGNNTFGDVVDIISNLNTSFTQPHFMVTPNGANPTDFPQTPSTATDGGAALEGRQFGYLYNWCAAMGNQQGTAACMQTEAPLPNPSISICPAGWRLPTGGVGGEFMLLNNAVNNGQTATDLGLRASWFGMYGGNGLNGSGGQGWNGSYWSSTIADASNSLAMFFSATNVDSVNSRNASFGHAVRCVADTPLIQDVTLENCPLERTMVRDARDDRTYWIRRIPNTRQGGGDLCWMETNLAYAGGGDNRFGDVMNIGTTPGTLTAGTSSMGSPIPSATASGAVCRGDNASLNTHGRGCFWEPGGSNPTTYPATPSTAANGTGQFGFLYNWCAAMGGQPAACQTTAATPADPTINICPAGWRLPAVGSATNSNTNEFWNINQAINGGATGFPIGLRSNGLLQQSGIFANGNFVSQGINGAGGYWSSTVFAATNARHFWFADGGVSPAVSGGKGVGFAIRCVAD